MERENKVLKVEAFFKTINESNEVVANIGVDKYIECSNKELKLDSIFEDLKERASMNIPKGYIVVGLSKEEMEKLEGRGVATLKEAIKKSAKK